MKYTTPLTLSQVAGILKINEHTINALTTSGRIPHEKTAFNYGNEYWFNTIDLTKWLELGPNLNIDNETFVKHYARQLERKYPEALARLRNYDKQFVPKKKKQGYSLSKVKNKKLGFVYYVRYIVNGKLVTSRWSTHTNNESAAINFALSNKEKLLNAYYEKKKTQNSEGKMYSVLNKYYSKDSPYMETDKKRGRVLSEKARSTYHNTITKKFIPFFKKNDINNFNDINTSLLSRLQNYWLADRKTVNGSVIPGIKPQVVNQYMSHISMIFDHMVQEGVLKRNPCKDLSRLKVTQKDQKATGCYNITELKGIFNKRWDNHMSYLLNLMIYTTNMRNCEIERAQIKDFFQIGNTHFLNIPESKSINGERIVPIHDFVYKKIMTYVKKTNKSQEDYLFKTPDSKKIQSKIYTRAYTDMAKLAGYDMERVAKENLRFYSGRHFWKTLMNSERLGEDAEEVFMGHKVKSDVKKRYNHIDKQGVHKVIAKAKQIFKILEKRLFTQ